jgi:transcriptional regulator with XRE-family HTH domain
MRLTNNGVKLIRKAFDLSMREFASIVGCNASLICRIESGEKNVSDRISQKICEKFEITEEKLQKIEEFYAGILH